MTELEKLARVGRQALNLQIMEVKFHQTESTSRRIIESDMIRKVVYNKENISEKEVEAALEDGSYENNPHLIVLDVETAANLFPHAGESKNLPKSYWTVLDLDPTRCECSTCGGLVNTDEALEPKPWSAYEFIGINYKYCPHCGSNMTAIKLRSGLSAEKGKTDG